MLKKIYTGKLSIILRAFLLIGLLNSLLFSAGEGIRLLPFPFSDTSQSANFNYHNNQEQTYEKTFHRFKNNSQNYQLKNQKNSDNHSINFASAPHSVDSPGLDILPNRGFPQQQNIYLAQLFKVSYAGRAPPQV